MPKRPDMRLKPLLLAILLGGVFSPVYGGAQIIGVYENCRFANVTVVVSDSGIPKNVGVEAEIAAAKSGNLDDATRAAKQVLDLYGISQISVERRGYSGCAKPSSGKYVQALGHYCEGQLVRAEILIDGRVFAQQSDEKQSFEDFVEHQRQRLRKQGILDEPQVTVQNDENCAQPRSS